MALDKSTYFAIFQPYSLPNSYKPVVPFVGHMQNSIAPDVASHLGLFCLLREFSSKNGIKLENLT